MPPTPLPSQHGIRQPCAAEMGPAGTEAATTKHANVAVRRDLTTRIHVLGVERGRRKWPSRMRDENRSDGAQIVAGGQQPSRARHVTLSTVAE